MRYTKATEIYNDRRYGKPWMAKLTTSIAKDFQFIDWDGRPGGAGEFCFDAEPGTLLARGQKDKGKGGIDGYQICMPDGSMPEVSDSQVMALKKLPADQRCAEAARLKIEANEKIIAEYGGKMDTYSISKVVEAKTAIAKYQVILTPSHSA